MSLPPYIEWFLVLCDFLFSWTITNLVPIISLITTSWGRKVVYMQAHLKPACKLPLIPFEDGIKEWKEPLKITLSGIPSSMTLHLDSFSQPEKAFDALLAAAVGNNARFGQFLQSLRFPGMFVCAARSMLTLDTADKVKKKKKTRTFHLTEGF